MLVALAWLTATPLQAANKDVVAASDSTIHVVRKLEMPTMQQRVMNSAKPVTLTQQGRRLCVFSRYEQLLPIYRADGTFYQAVRLTKGTTWINGLPRGRYIINSKEYTIH
ncbi:MAG: hypothetical protein J5486_00655 [Bacteroidaceae bacterium]|nr:hypothetical protein [Bacteroidaceae bacterium]